jgi:hypothetical protein
MNLFLAAALVAVATGVAVAVMLFVRRRAPEGSFFSDGDRASGVFGVLATGFSILLGFVVFLSFSTYDTSRAGADLEAVTIFQQVETAQFFPREVSGRLTGELICYGRSVVHEEWPSMEAGTLGDSVNPWGIELFKTIEGVEPSTAREQTAYDKWFDQTSEREQARLDRVHGAAGVIPAPLWIVIFFTSILIFAYMLFFADSAEMKRSQAMLIGSAATVVVVTVLAIYALDNPYRPGLGSIQPRAMERTLVILGEEQAAVGVDAPVPCDEQGVASS